MVKNKVQSLNPSHFGEFDPICLFKYKEIGYLVVFAKAIWSLWPDFSFWIVALPRMIWNRRKKLILLSRCLRVTHHHFLFKSLSLIHFTLTTIDPTRWIVYWYAENNSIFINNIHAMESWSIFSNQFPHFIICTIWYDSYLIFAIWYGQYVILWGHFSDA